MSLSSKWCFSYFEEKNVFMAFFVISCVRTYHYSVYKSYYQYFLLDTLCILSCIIKGIYSSSRNRQIFVSAHALCRFKLEQQGWIVTDYVTS